MANCCLGPQKKATFDPEFIKGCNFSVIFNKPRVTCCHTYGSAQMFLFFGVVINVFRVLLVNYIELFIPK